MKQELENLLNKDFEKVNDKEYIELEFLKLCGEHYSYIDNFRKILNDFSNKELTEAGLKIINKTKYEMNI